MLTTAKAHLERVSVEDLGVQEGHQLVALELAAVVKKVIKRNKTPSDGGCHSGGGLCSHTVTCSAARGVCRGP